VELLILFFLTILTVRASLPRFSKLRGTEGLDELTSEDTIDFSTAK
jgi:hypothetical protein